MLINRRGAVKLWLEFISVFVFVPLLIFCFRGQLAPFAVPIIIIVATYSFVVLSRAGVIKKQIQKMRSHSFEDYQPMLVFFGATSILMLLLGFILGHFSIAHAFEHERLYLILLVLLYPLVSVIPQELVFRTFFFHRYRKLFTSLSGCAIASGLCFGYAHIIYGNWTAVILATIGGMLFSYRYMKTNATNIVVLEHSLWGIFVFVIGFADQFIAWQL
jgi:uncharacterized protein